MLQDEAEAKIAADRSALAYAQMNYDTLRNAGVVGASSVGRQAALNAVSQAQANLDESSKAADHARAWLEEMFDFCDMAAETTRRICNWPVCGRVNLEVAI